MPISDKQLEEFRAIYKKVYSKEVSRDEAYDQATRLLYYVMETTKPMTVEEYNKALEYQKTVILPRVLEYLAHCDDATSDPNKKD